MNAGTEEKKREGNREEGEERGDGVGVANCLGLGH